MKPGTFTQLYIQIVFAVKYRDRLLHESFRTEVFKYISGIISNKEHKSIIVNGVSDHIHIFIGLNPKMALSNLIGEIKRNSSIFINEQKWIKGHFAWQEGYGAFSYSRLDIDNVYKYILNQEKHHKRKSFKHEYLSLLKQFNIEYDEKYLFDFFE